MPKNGDVRADGFVWRYGQYLSPKAWDKKLKQKRAAFKSSAIGIGRLCDSGRAGELIVRTDLLLRGLEVTVPENPNSPDDVHFKSKRGWRSIQVKVAKVNNNTGCWTYSLKKPITSDIIAWVDLRNRIIRYKRNKYPVSPELL